MSENCLVFESIFGAFWTPKMDEKSMKNRSSGSSWAKMAPRRCHLEPTWLQEPVFEWFSNQILNQFRLLSDWFWADICSLQEQLFIIFRSILNHFRLMSDRFWIDIYSILTWIGLMFTRCWDRFSSDLNKSILTLIATRPPLGLAALASKSRWTPLLLTPVFVVHKRTNSITESAIHQS